MKLKDRLDRRYLKLCAYVAGTALVIFIAALLVWESRVAVGSIVRVLGAAIVPLLLGAMLSYLIHPLVVRIAQLMSTKENIVKQDSKRWALATSLSLLIVVVVILGLLALIVLLVTKSLTSISLGSITALWDSLQSDFSKLFAWIGKSFGEKFATGEVLGDFAEGFIKSVSSGVTTLFFALIFAVYFLYDSKRLTGYAKRIVKAVTGKDIGLDSSQFLQDADRVFSTYIRGQAVDVLIISAAFAVSLAIAGVPYGPAIGILGGLGNIIPGMGFILASLLLLLVCITQNQIRALVIGLIVITIINAIDANIISPRLMRHHLNVHPLLTLAALLIGGAAAGLGGMLIAVPTAALIKLRFDRWLDKRKI